MATVTYAYAVAQTVWVITDGVDCPSAVRTGDIAHIRINIKTTTDILYDILLTGDKGPITFVEADVFASLALASAEYELRLT